MKDLTIWCTFHDDAQIEQYKLCNTESLRLFRGNNLDVSGDNINHPNKFYSEIVTMYWVWKNHIRSSRVGFCHYRRRFGHILDLDNQSCQALAINTHCNVMAHYKGAHNYQDLYDMVDILNKHYGCDNQYSGYLLRGMVFIPYCCFIMHWDTFASIYEFLFPLLFSFDQKHSLNMIPERYIDKAKHDFRYDNVDYQCRAMSFLAERLISAYLYCNLHIVCIISI